MVEQASGDKNQKSNLTRSSQLNYMLHNLQPDYTRPLFEIPPEARERMCNRLRFLYGEKEAETWMPHLERILKVYYAHKPQEMIDAEKDCDPRERFTEKDIILITYGDLFRGGEGHPLSVLHKLVLEKILGIGEQQLVSGSNVEYVKDTENSVDQSIEKVDRRQKQAAFFMNPITIEQLKAVTEAGERMPQKSTYFYPKIYTGLTINKL